MANSLPSFGDVHRAKTGKVSDKWDSYLEFYEETFASIRDKPLRILEIGVQNGGSLETYAEYFPNAKLIVGCDIDPKCGDLKYDNPNIHVIVGNANSADAFQKITALSRQYDLIIDDGSHRSADIFNAFVNYFPLLAPDCKFIVEDACCLYLSKWGGGIANEADAMSFFKRLSDVPSYEFWKKQMTIQSHLSTHFPTTVPKFILEGWVQSVAFQNSIVTIRKSKTASHDKLGERVITGTEALVSQWGGKTPTKRFHDY